MTISPVSNTCTSCGTSSQTQKPPVNNSTSDQPQDTVQLSSHALGKLKGSDADGD
jgi:hypothetical protein